MPSATAPAPHGYTDGGNAQPSQPSMSGTSQWGGSQHMSSRDEIIAAQEKLQQENLYHGKIDGLLGPETRQALRDYQRQHGLRVTENLDQATKNSLLGTTGQGSSTPPTSPSPGAGDRRPSQ
jgi:peptidoglycan hydrolase-like protein with peptidoglycan-binding domain